jgi:DNA-binding GntR family transcriptional regulator
MPLQRLTTAHAVADQLRDSIQRGVLRPGTRLRQAQIAKEFGVSTTPVREAFALLRSEGFVEIDPHRGAMVFTATIADITETYEIRTALELLAATKALPNLDDGIVDQMQRLTDQMRKATNSTGYLELNHRFHDALYQAAGRPRLSSIIDSLHVSVAGYLQLYLSHLSGKARTAHFDKINIEHQEIVDACRARDARGLTRALQVHRDRTVEAIVAMLEATPPDDRSKSKPR